MKVLFAAVAVMAAMVGSGASALDPVHLKRLKVTNECKGCELSSADLSNANLVKANLRFADLSGANLSGADLGLALINGAILCNTTMPDGSVLYSGC
tara:strand:- start:312 stop:602 length:291 start_codon:yes stop_codon:yes gene_type:complete